MRIPLSLKCPNCDEPRHQVVHLSDQSADFTCAKCGRTSYGIPGLGVTVGFLILARSWHEFEVEKDYDMTIVLAATALDCELSLLYQKWKEVDAVGNGTTLDTEAFERELRGMGSVADKITKISEFLYVGGIETFVASSQQWTNKIQKDFPSLRLGSLATDFQRTVFWPRNAVLHQGKADHTKGEAARCYSIAWLGIQVLKEMDKSKFAALGL